MGISSNMTRRRMLRIAGGLSVGAAGVAALAACGETEPTVITKEVAVETTVIKEVPVETIVTRTEVKEVPVDRIVTQEKIVTKEVQVPVEVQKIVTQVVEVEKVVEKTVVKEVMVEAEPMRPPVRLEFSTDWGSGVRAATHKYMAAEVQQGQPARHGGHPDHLGFRRQHRCWLRGHPHEPAGGRFGAGIDVRAVVER